MSLILYLETATAVCSVALSNDKELLALRESVQAYSHSTSINLFIQEVLDDSNHEIQDLDAVIVSKGPGSYTGLRIGTSTAKGICYGLDIPLLAVSTLEALAWGIAQTLEDDCYLCPMIDARRMEVYTAVYDMNLYPIEPISAKIIDQSSFNHLLDKKKMCFFGDGSSKCSELLIHPNATFIDDVVCSASNLIALGNTRFTEKLFEDLAYYVPFYLKDFVSLNKQKA